MLRITVRNNATSRWEVTGYPKSYMYDEWIKGSQPYNFIDQGWNMEHVNNKAFYVQINLKDTPIIDTFEKNFQYYDDFIEFEFTVQTNRILGIGGRQSSSLVLGDGIYILFNKGQNIMDNGKKPGKNKYDPSIFNVPSNKWKIYRGFMKNSNAIDIFINSPYIPKAQNVSITFKISGGIHRYVYIP